jgi:nitroreductase
MEVRDAIRRKRAVRQYTSEPLPPGVVEAILHAGRRAQSSKNTQPWHFIAVQDRATIDSLAAMGDFTGPLKTAALVVALVTPDPANAWWVMFDAGQAASYMQLAGVEMGVGSCIVSLHRPEGAGALLGFPDDLRCHVVLSFGYPQDPAAFDPPRPREGRRPPSDVIHYGRFGRHEPQP